MHRPGLVIENMNLGLIIPHRTAHGCFDKIHAGHIPNRLPLERVFYLVNIHLRKIVVTVNHHDVDILHIT